MGKAGGSSLPSNGPRIGEAEALRDSYRCDVLGHNVGDEVRAPVA